MVIYMLSIKPLLDDRHNPVFALVPFLLHFYYLDNHVHTHDKQYDTDVKPFKAGCC